MYIFKALLNFADLASPLRAGPDVFRKCSQFSIGEKSRIQKYSNDYDYISE